MYVAGVVSTALTTAGLPYFFNLHRYCCFGFLFWSSYSCWKRNRRISMPGISNFLPPSASISTDSSAGTTSTEPQAVPKPNQHQQWLIVGLGNPGRIFRGSRHNVGFEMLDAIAEANGISVTSVSYKALVGKGFIENVPVMLAKPQTFMNLSGESVGDIVSYYKIPLKQVLVIFDDLDLPFAKLRLLPKGGHGGQNGMRSIIDHFNGSCDFPRLRIGIGRPPGKMYPFNFVLRQFSKQEWEELDFTFERGVEAVRILLLEGFNKAATYVNSARPVE